MCVGLKNFKAVIMLVEILNTPLESECVIVT